MTSKPFNENAAIRGAIRRTFARSPVIREVMHKVRKEFPRYNKDGTRGRKDHVCYLCNVCKQYHGSTKISVDHIESVISIHEGFVDWNTFVERLFCTSENLQVICDDCHQTKTNQERFQRTFNKESKEINVLYSKILKDETLSELELRYIHKFTKKRLEKYPATFINKIKQIKSMLK